MIRHHAHIKGLVLISVVFYIVGFSLIGVPWHTQSTPLIMPHKVEVQNHIALVSVAHDPSSIAYPAPWRSPYKPDENPTYTLVQDALSYLNPTTPDNPLTNLIQPGDTVVIKPNLVGKSGFDREGVTRTPILRPLVDFAVQAGATRVIIAEGSATPYLDSAVFNSAYSNITGLVAALQEEYPHTLITFQDLNLDAFTWVDLASNSSLFGIYTAKDLYTFNKIRMDEDSFYHAVDSTGYNPHGYRPGLYAIANTIFQADVFINVPKMKVHFITGVTLSLKNLIGITPSSTGNTTHEESIKDTPHWNNDVPKPLGEYLSREDSFDNDVLWRVMADLHKIVLYTDETGRLQSTKTRGYLSVVDGIIGMEGPTIYNPPGTPRPTGVIVAGHNPVAVDTVCTRIMGFNYTILNTLINIAQETEHPIGLADPAAICVIGTSLNTDTFPEKYTPHQGYEDDYIAPYQIRLQHEEAPPINQITIDPNISQGNPATHITITSSRLEDIAACWLRYHTLDTPPKIVKLEPNEIAFHGWIESLDPGTPVTFSICLQDDYLNTAWSVTQTFLSSFHDAFPVLINQVEYWLTLSSSSQIMNLSVSALDGIIRFTVTGEENTNNTGKLTVPRGLFDQPFTLFIDQKLSASRLVQNATHSTVLFNYTSGRHELSILGTIYEASNDNMVPQAAFTYQPTMNLTIHTMITFTDSSTDPDGNIRTWLWSFGDGVTSTQQHPTHRYTAPGHYLVKLTVSDNKAANTTTSTLLAITMLSDTTWGQLPLLLISVGTIVSCIGYVIWQRQNPSTRLWTRAIDSHAMDEYP